MANNLKLDRLTFSLSHRSIVPDPQLNDVWGGVRVVKNIVKKHDSQGRIFNKGEEIC